MLHVVDTLEAFVRQASPSMLEYFRAFSAADREARRCFQGHTIVGYLTRVMERPYAAATAAALPELERAVREAESRLQQAGDGALAEAMLRRSAATPWRVALLDDAAEGGWPHTHGAVICLPRRLLSHEGGRAELVRVLIHERIHVLQRAEPEAARACVRRLYGQEVRPFATRAQAAAAAGIHPQLLRSNPDLDGRVYGGRFACLCAFASLRDARERGMSASTCVPVPLPGGAAQDPARTLARTLAHAEHPYEAMAYDIADACMRRSQREPL